MIGFDYGIKPNIMVVGDVEYTSLIHEAAPVAIGYGKIPSFGLLVEPPLVCLIFEDEDKGKECFKHLKKWGEGSNNDDAVALSFIEENKGGYTICVYPDFNHLIDRCIPKYLQPEVNPMIMASISFPLSVERISQDYLFFKQQIKERAFVFCGASKTGKLFLDFALRKIYIQFYKEDEIQEDQPEYSYFVINSKGKRKGRFVKKPLSEKSEAISNRRWIRLKTFFPITLEKLNYNTIFQNSRDLLLSEGFSQWQILQGACNIVVSVRMCNKPCFAELDKKPAPMDILEYLLNNFEKPEDDISINEGFSVEILRKQIIADSIELLQHAGRRPKETSKKALLSSLTKKGFLNSEK